MTIGRLAWVGLLAARALAAQASDRVTGTVLRPSGADAVPVPNVTVVLHRVGRATQGPIDSIPTDGSGRFALPIPRDTTANYLLSARYAGIAYFSSVLGLGGAADTGIRILVFDTSSVAKVRTRSRTLIVSGPDALGSRQVVDWFVMVSAANVTRVGRDSLDPTWGAALPPGATEVQLGDVRLNQFSAETVVFRNDSVLVMAPLSPSDKELLIQYGLPRQARRLEVPAAGVDSMDLFVEEAGAKVAPPGWKVSDQTFEGRRFHRYVRGARSEPVVVRFPGLGISPNAVLPWLVAGFGLLLSCLTWVAVRRSRRSPAVG